MNKKVFILIIIVVLLTVFNVLQYDKMRNTEIEHQLEIDSLAYEIVNLKDSNKFLEAGNEYLLNYIVEDEVERAKDFEAE